MFSLGSFSVPARSFETAANAGGRTRRHRLSAPASPSLILHSYDLRKRLSSYHLGDEIDDQVLMVNNIVSTVDIEEEYSDIGKKRLQLPFRLRGMGYRKLADRADAQLIGGLYHDGLVRLIDRHDDEGNCWPGRLNTPIIVDALGAGSFDAGSEKPWEHLIDSNSQLGAVLNTAWTKYEEFYQASGLAASEKGDDMLIAQPVELAGFYGDGRRPPKVTKAITDEIEQARYEILDQEILDLPTDNPERWAWMN